MSGERRRLLVLTSTFPRWVGDVCPMFVADLSQALAQRFVVTVLAPASPGALSAERWGDVTVRRFRYAWPASAQRLADGAILPNLKRNRLLAWQVPTFILAQLVAAWRLAQREAFDVLHAHWALPQGWTAATVKARVGTPAVTTCHGADLYALRAGPARRAKRWALNASDRVTAVSASLKDEAVALGVAADRVAVLPMGIDAERFHPQRASDDARRELNPHGPALLFVGRLAEKKGARYAIEAMPRLLREQPDARLVLVGDGPERPALEQLSRRLGLNGSVVFAGARPHHALPPLFASADVFLGPSVVARNGDTESFGLVFGEAMASGCPVVATDVGGISDLVVDGETGYLVPQRDADALAHAALRLLRDDNERARLRTNGIAWVRERFDRNTLAARYGDLLEEVAA